MGGMFQSPPTTQAPRTDRSAAERASTTSALTPLRPKPSFRHTEAMQRPPGTTAEAWTPASRPRTNSAVGRPGQLQASM